MKKIWIIQFITFLSAFLLFQLELIIAKRFLPIYGGSYLVWGGCLVFFQATLLAGYAFAHYVIQKIGFGRYRLLHLFLFILSLVFFPGKALPHNYDVSSLPMVIDLFLQLAAVIGPAFFVLSTMSIVTQVWVSESHLPQRSNPYALYATSNLGSILGLLTYPFFFEIFYDLLTQELIWRLSYIVLIGLNIAAYIFIGVRNSEPRVTEEKLKISAPDAIRWLCFSAAGVMLFLSVTNIITIEIVPMPLLWVLPLSIFLISYILNFKENPWCPNWIKNGINISIGCSVFVYFAMQAKVIPVLAGLIIILGLLFHICMYCQYQLYRHKPKDRGQLSFYYLLISLGGFLGGMLVTWIIPVVSNSLIEYLLSLLCVTVGMLVGRKDWKLGFKNIRLTAYLTVLLFIVPMAVLKLNILTISCLVVLIVLVYKEFRDNVNALMMSLVVVLCLTSPLEFVWANTEYIFRQRNYYGVYRVYDKKNVRYLVHGTTIHGAQFTDEDKKPVPLTYYSLISPVGELLTSDLFHFGKIAIQGLGVGTLATYFNSNQAVDYFELDPDNYAIAQEYFDILKRSSGKIRCIIGDARVTLDSVEGTKYDLMISDAFGGDAIPIHLTTQEALKKYRNFMTEEGVILVHISSRYVDHSPALYSTAISIGAHVSYKEGMSYSDKIYSSNWVAITWSDKKADVLRTQLDWRKVHPDLVKKHRPWTDNYSNVLPYLRIDNLFVDLNRFKFF